MRHISQQDALKEGSRGHTSLRALQKLEAPEAPPPAAPIPAIQISPDTEQSLQNLTASMNAVANGLVRMELSHEAASGTLLKALSEKPVLPEPTNKWTFRVTERDRAGNILEFTATRN